ncbi:MAG: glycosyltransferase family 2 protein [Gemmatimonadota bacterium]|nr:glycosyltransferase family 2 protein [Gemmatimonadota bacterium]
MTLLPLLALPWLLSPLALIRLARKTPSLEQHPAVEDGPLVSVIVPARNEAASITTVITSVLATSYRNVELIVVDDRSTDATAALVRDLASGDARLRLISGSELPPGWYGKPWACHQGALDATGEILLFTDADTRHAPALLGHAVSTLRATGADLLTIAPEQQCLSFWERTVMPQVWLLLGLRYHPDTVNHARHASEVIANGQFIMIPRATYEAMGTHAAVRREVAEDLALAQHYWSAGRRLHFAFAERLMTTRMYSNLPEIIEGWSKNIYLGGRRSYPDEPWLRALVPVTLSVAMSFWLLPPALLVLSLVGVTPAALLTPALLATLGSATFWSLMSFGMQIPPKYGLAYPLGAAMTLFIVARSTLRGAGRIEWKGRTYGRAVNRE